MNDGGCCKHLVRSRLTSIQSLCVAVDNFVKKFGFSDEIYFLKLYMYLIDKIK
jgi:hypothetical protein